MCLCMCVYERDLCTSEISLISHATFTKLSSWQAYGQGTRSIMCKHYVFIISFNAHSYFTVSNINFKRELIKIN